MRKIKIMLMAFMAMLGFMLVPAVNAEDLIVINCNDYKNDEKLPEEVFQKLEDIIPDGMYVDITKTDYVNNLVDVDVLNNENPLEDDLLIKTLSKQITSLLLENGIQITNIDPSMNISVSYWIGEGELDKARFFIGDFEKDFEVEFAKEKNYNAQDEKYVKDVVSKIKFDNYYGEDALITMYNVGDFAGAEKWDINTFNVSSIINDKTVSYKITAAAGGMGGGPVWGIGSTVYFIKNGVVYDQKNVMNIGAYGITLSNGVKVSIGIIEKDDDYEDNYKLMSDKLKQYKLDTIIGCYNLEPFSPVSGKVNISLRVDTKYNGKPVKVLQKKKDNKYVLHDGVVANGKVTIPVTDVESQYMIALVKNIPITGVKINQKNPTVVIKKTTKLTATITPGNTTQSKKVTWSTSNKKIATVDKNGVVKGIKAGTVNITVKTSNGKTATVKVTVKKAKPIKSVKLNKKTLKLELGKSATVKATINPSNTTDSKKLTWSSSNKKVAVVDKNGKITAKAAGTAKITVKTSNGKKATVKVTVSKISAKKAKISAIKNQVQTGKALKPAVTVKLGKTTLKNGRDYTVSYKNNKNAGKATVTVKFKGNYTGSSKKVTFLIIPSKVNIKNPSTSKKAITVKYSKVSGAKTYQIAYRLKGTKKWSYTTSKSSSKKISKLTSGKEYEVIVRAGIKNGSKTLYGAWSRTKVIKVK